MLSDQAWAKAKQISSLFCQKGAISVEPDILQPADFLLDLYGEDIRARAYITSDPLRGDLMVRPDFTVPIAKMHLESRKSLAQYCYHGKVFRRQESDLQRANEYLQVGYERFGDHNEPEADAEVFTTIRDALDGADVSVQTGDMSVLTTAVEGLRTTPERRAALMRHIWRPNRFRSLLNKYAGVEPRLNKGQAEFCDETPFIGVRRREEVTMRLGILQRDAESAPISKAELELLTKITQLKESYSHVISILRDFMVDLPHLTAPIDTIERRLEALNKRGVETDHLIFEGSFGRTSMEYYDGFVFGFSIRRKDEYFQIASGGRYNALMKQMTQKDNLGAVGGVIRPALLDQEQRVGR